MDNTVSWVNARHRKDPGTPKNFYENDQFGLIHRRIPGQYRWKADQWALLCRNHASQIIGIDRPHIPFKYHLWHSYSDINASDEMYIPTSLALLGLLRFTSQGEDTQALRGLSETPKNDGKPGSTSAAPAVVATPSNTFEFVKKRPVTYTDWSEGMRNPVTFTKGVTDLKKVARLAREKGCLVARKFAPFVPIPGVAKEDHEITGNITVEEWREVIERLVIEQPQEKLVINTSTPLQPEDAETTAAAATTTTTTTTEQDVKSEPKNEEPQKDDDGSEGESFITRKTQPGKNKRNDDDDDEENQLE